MGYGYVEQKEDTMRVLIADDHPTLRETVVRALAGEPDIEVVGVAGDGAEAVEMARELRPDVILMDVMMPALNGIEATREILKCCPKVHILGFSVHDSRVFAARMLKAGALGYLLKDGDITELRHAVKAVAHGETYVSPEITNFDA